MKLCKDCRFAALETDKNQKVAWRCQHPTATTLTQPDYVTGGPQREYQRECSVARISGLDGWCGPQGRYWEPRP